MKYFNLFTLILSFFIFHSCSVKVLPEENTTEKTFQLVSPRGHVLAKDMSKLKDMIIAKEEGANKEDLTILSVEHFDEEGYTASIINYSINGKHTSMLTTSELGDDHIVLSDRNTVEIVKVGDEPIIITDDTETIIIDK